jgi:hypothetical protein
MCCACSPQRCDEGSARCGGKWRLEPGQSQSATGVCAAVRTKPPLSLHGTSLCGCGHVFCSCGVIGVLRTCDLVLSFWVVLRGGGRRGGRCEQGFVRYQLPLRDFGVWRVALRFAALRCAGTGTFR